MVTSKFGERVYSIIDAAVNVHRMLGEGITSGDFEVVTCKGGVTFDPVSMEDTVSDVPFSGERSVVLFTTEMGLKRESRGVKEGHMMKESSILLKPKVALESVVAQFSNPTETKRH